MVRGGRGCSSLSSLSVSLSPSLSLSHGTRWCAQASVFERQCLFDVDQGGWLAEGCGGRSHGAQRDTGRDTVCGMDGVLVGRQQCDGAGTRLLEVVFPADE